MVSSLLHRKVSKRPDRIRFDGRILFLTEDPHLIRRQLEGEDLVWHPGLPLRHDISTDEIAPAYICYYFDETLGEFAYIGLQTGGQSPVTRGSVKRGGFVASVSGRRRGKGSSREQAPYAELSAGIRLVIAENIERIYRQNCQNLGLLTSTNFDLIERLERGEEVALSEFTEGEDEITAQIIEYGGLFAFNVARLQGQARLPQLRTSPRPMTLAEKILARHMVVDIAQDRVGVPAVKPGDAGFVRADIRFSHEYVTPMAAILFKQLVGEHEKVNDPSSIYFFRDHLTFLDQVMPPERRAMGLLDLALQQKLMQEAFAREQGITYHGELTDRKGSEGICHNIILENYALPGQVIVGTDSHTPHAGAIGCVAFGVGTTDMFNSWITKDVRMCVPPSVKIIARGRCPAGVTAKDLILAILRLEYVKSGQAIGKVIEYAGEAIEALSIDERATMTNMAAEIGGFTGLVAPDNKTVDFLVERRGLPRAEAERLCEGLFSDHDATYDHVIELDASQLRPMIALPGDPSQGVFIDELTEDIPIEIAYGGSCTAGKKADMDMYARVLREALQQGRGVHPSVKFYIQFGSQEVRRYCVEQGYLDIFHRAGATVIEPSCGACINAGPGGTSRADQISISAQNRNFPGRSGPGQLYLANPLTVAASAVAGKIVAYKEPSEGAPAHP